MRSECAKEREERQTQAAHLQVQINDMKKAMKNLDTKNTPFAASSRSNEIDIGEISAHSKIGAINFCTTPLRNAEGLPQIVEDRIGGAPDVQPVKVSSFEFAQKFINDYKDKKPFDKCWCNFSQTPKEHANFKQHVQPLFKIKRAVLEVADIEAKNIVVKKNEKKVYAVNGVHLKLIATMVSRI